MWRLVTCSNFSDFGTPRSKFRAFGTPQPRWDPSLLPPDVAFLACRGLLDRVDGPASAPALKQRVWHFHIEGFRIDPGGVRIPFRIRGGTVRCPVCTLPSATRASSFDWKRGQRIGEAGNPGPPWERGGIYFGRFSGEPILHVGVLITRIGETQEDYEYVFAIPTRSSLPGACEARARDGPFICDCRFVKTRGIRGLRRERGTWTCTGWAPVGRAVHSARYVPRIDDLDLAYRATEAGAAPVRYRLVPPPGPADVADAEMPAPMPPADNGAAEVQRALQLAQANGLQWTEEQCRLLLDGFVADRRGAEDLPHGAAWAGIIEYIPGKDIVEAEALLRLMYPSPDMPSDAPFGSFWADVQRTLENILLILFERNLFAVDQAARASLVI